MTENDVPRGNHQNGQASRCRTNYAHWSDGPGGSSPTLSLRLLTPPCRTNHARVSVVENIFLSGRANSCKLYLQNTLHFIIACRLILSTASVVYLYVNFRFHCTYIFCIFNDCAVFIEKNKQTFQTVQWLPRLYPYILEGIANVLYNMWLEFIQGFGYRAQVCQLGFLLSPVTAWTF